MARKKQCNHKMTRYDWGRDATGAEVAISRWCLGCGAQLGIGPSNDEPEAVQVEMRAAEMEDTEHWGPRKLTSAEIYGYEDLIDPLSPTSNADVGHQLLAGYLCARIEGRFPNYAGWSWDPSRPIAEQLAGTARDDAEADAMEYEVTRSAEPDCRDEDEADEVVVCSCAGDALRSERCEAKS